LTEEKRVCQLCHGDLGNGHNICDKCLKEIENEINVLEKRVFGEKKP